MKIVSLEVKKIGVGKFFPKENNVELRILFNDGSDREILKNADIGDPQGAAEGIITSLRKLEKKLNKNEKEGSIIDNFVNIVVKDEEAAIKEISNFIYRVGLEIKKINGKKDAEGYLDMIRNLKSLKLEF